MAVRLLAVDLDGTIVPKGRTITPEAVAALQAVIDGGLTLVPATGRCLENVPDQILGLKGLRYVISSNGAVVMDMRQGKPIHRSLIPWRQAASMLRMLTLKDAYSCVYADNHIYNRKTLPEFMARPDYLAGVFCKNTVDDLPGFIEERRIGVEKIFIAVWEPEIRSMLRVKLMKRPGIIISSSSMRNLEVNRLGTDKGIALRFLAGRLGLAREEIAAAGDNENDLQMLRFAGTAIVPSDGTPEAKAEAAVITDPCTEDGVARYIRRFIP
jgi:Cof subfamily protein (haloacid dehalogenase superfamily)